MYVNRNIGRLEISESRIDKLVYLSTLVPISLFFLYWYRPDFATALTVFPTWVWLVFWLCFVRQIMRKSFLILSLAWIVFSVVHIEEIYSMYRLLQVTPKFSKNTIKVVTINSSSLISAVREVHDIDTDIILIQESPKKDDLENYLSNKKGYQVLYGVDTSILIQGKIDKLAETSFYTAGIATMNGVKFLIVSLRLKTSNPRIDLWNIDCWKDQTTVRLKQLDQIKEVKSLLQSKLPTIVGGDFNVPQGDKVFSEISSTLKDSFTNCGIGWGNTILNDLPVLRVDQIWMSNTLNCHMGITKGLENSDHRSYSVKIYQ